MKSEFAALRRRRISLSLSLSISQVFDAGIFIYLGIRSTISVDRIGVERNLALSPSPHFQRWKFFRFFAGRRDNPGNWFINLANVWQSLENV